MLLFSKLNLYASNTFLCFITADLCQLKQNADVQFLMDRETTAYQPLFTNVQCSVGSRNNVCFIILWILWFCLDEFLIIMDIFISLNVIFFRRAEYCFGFIFLTNKIATGLSS